MEKKWIAIPAAVALSVTLASCGQRTNWDDYNRTAFDNDRVNGVDTAPYSYQARTSVPGIDGTLYYNNGRYAAYPDGTVSPGHGALARDTERMARDAGQGVKNATVGARNTLDNLGRNIKSSTTDMR